MKMKKALFFLIVLVSVLAFTFPGQIENKGIKDELTGFNSPGRPFDFGSQWALVIGINNYSYYDNLRYAQPEAGAVKELLISRYGFNPGKVKSLYDDNATRDIIMEQLKSFVVNLEETDNLFIYFSGHGFVDHILKIFYWLPADAGKDRREIRDKNQRISRSNIKISSEEIRGILKECKAKHIFVVADSCFSARLFVLESKKGNLPGYYKRKSRQLFASGRELVGDGVFGKYFIDYLKTNEVPYIMASDLISEVKRNVVNNSELEPEGRAVRYTDDKNGEFILVRRLAALKHIKYQPNFPTDPADIEVGDLKAQAERIRLQRKKEKADWQSKQWEFQKEVEKQQKTDEDKKISFTSKRKTWEDILSRNRKDNPYSVEDEELRKFVSGRIEYWKAKEREEARWAKWQKKFQRNVEKIKEIEEDPDISSSAKREKWEELLKAYRKDNPYSEEDERLRGFIKQHIRYWKDHIEAPNESTIPNTFWEFKELEKRILAAKSYEILNQVTGAVTKVEKTNGSEVKNGDVIFAIDSTVIESEIRSAKWNVKKWERMLFKRKQWKSRSPSAELQAKRQIKRYNDLILKKQEELAKCVIKVYIDGRLVSLTIKEGDYIDEGSVVGKVVDTKKVKITLSKYAYTVKDGQRLKIRIKEISKNVSGTVKKYSDNSADIFIENKDYKILIGMTAVLKI